MTAEELQAQHTARVAALQLLLADMEDFHRAAIINQAFPDRVKAMPMYTYHALVGGLGALQSQIQTHASAADYQLTSTLNALRNP
jgi:hypothetical protein